MAFGFGKGCNLHRSDLGINFLVGLGKTDTVSADNALSSFAVEAYKVAYQEGNLPAQVMMADVTPFQPETITDLEHTEFWTMQDAEDVFFASKHGH